MAAAPAADGALEAEPSVEDMVTRFFNDLELSQDMGDLQLLVEAERRGLSNPVADRLLAEARRRGWVAPKPGSKGALETYEVQYLGATLIEDVPTSRLPQHSEVSMALARISNNPRVAFQTMLLLEVHPETIGVFDVTSVLEAKEAAGEGAEARHESLGRRTLKKLRNLTLRKITGQRREQSSILGTPTDDADMVVEHNREAILSFLAIDKVVTCIIKEKDWMTGKEVYMCHAYKVRDRSKAQEIADHLSLSQRDAAAPPRKIDRPPPLQRFSLRREGGADFGIGVAGPAMHGEAALGVFVSSIAEGSAAEAMFGLSVGLQFVAINGENMEDATMSEVRQALMSASNELVLDMQENKEGWAMRQYQSGLKKPEVKFASDDNKPATDPSADIEAMLSALTYLSNDNHYATPMQSTVA